METAVDCPTPQSCRWLNLAISVVSSPTMPDKADTAKMGSLEFAMVIQEETFLSLEETRAYSLSYSAKPVCILRSIL